MYGFGFNKLLGEATSPEPMVGPLGQQVQFQPMNFASPVAATPGNTSLSNYFANQQASPGLFVQPVTTGKDAAQQTYARLVRTQFADWQKRYLPVAMNLISELGPGFEQMVGRELDRSRSTVSSAYQTAVGAAQRAAERYGIKRTFNFDLDETSATVGGLNNARLAAEDRRMAILSGGVGGK